MTTKLSLTISFIHKIFLRLALVYIFFIYSSCVGGNLSSAGFSTVRPSDTILSPDEMYRVMYDYQMLKASMFLFRDPTIEGDTIKAHSVDQAYQYFYQHHNVDEAMIDRSHRYYMGQTKLYLQIISKIETEIDNLQRIKLIPADTVTTER